ncbi:hypothetical protein BC332_13397 [Capsicum chinense]|nr:hypothetical protein BC332_13397 [Capsicum chinense]
MSSSDSSFWKEAVNSEIDSILNNHTWELVDLSPGNKPLGSKWIFKRKMKANAVYDLQIHQMDVKTAFLNGDLEKEIYMEQPEGFVVSEKENKVREPLPLIIHHLPIAVTFAFIGEELMVIDPTHHEVAVMGGRMSVTLNGNGNVYAIQKAGRHGVMQGVVMQCLRIASVKPGDITSKIKTIVESYKTERALRMVKRHAPSNAVDVNEPDQKAKQILEGQKLKSEECSVSQSDDMDVEQDRINKRSKKNRSFTGRPSSWDPYSEGVNTDESEATLASRDEFCDFILSVSLEFLVCGALTFNMQMRLHNDNHPNELYE